jgi:hypothetical protein
MELSTFIGAEGGERRSGMAASGGKWVPSWLSLPGVKGGGDYIRLKRGGVIGGGDHWGSMAWEEDGAAACEEEAALGRRG